MIVKLITSKYNKERWEVQIKSNGGKAVEVLDIVNMHT
jgi:hypothetical protein